MKQQSKQHSQMLIITHTQEQFHGMTQILSYYYLTQNNTNNQTITILTISNKYYKATVQLENKHWKDVLGFQSVQQENKESNTREIEQNELQQSQNNKNNKNNKDKKYDFMIMLLNDSKTNLLNSYQQIDQLIEKYNPDQFVLLINTSTPQNKWIDQEVVLQKCNNFIEIVKEDLAKIVKSKPKWSRGSLLTQDEEGQEEDGEGIFSILDRIETTRWENMVDLRNVNKSQNKKENKQIKKQEENESKEIEKQEQRQQSDKIQEVTQIIITKQTTHIVSENPSSKQESIANQQQNKAQLQKNISTKQEQNELSQTSKPQIDDNKSSSEQGQLSEQQLQKQMLQFQSMMGQMMSFKQQSSTLPDEERKKKAEQLFSKMFSKIMDN